MALCCKFTQAGIFMSKFAAYIHIGTFLAIIVIMACPLICFFMRVFVFHVTPIEYKSCLAQYTFIWFLLFMNHHQVVFQGKTMVKYLITFWTLIRLWVFCLSMAISRNLSDIITISNTQYINILKWKAFIQIKSLLLESFTLFSQFCLFFF